MEVINDDQFDWGESEVDGTYLFSEEVGVSVSESEIGHLGSQIPKTLVAKGGAFNLRKGSGKILLAQLARLAKRGDNICLIPYPALDQNSRYMTARQETNQLTGDNLFIRAFSTSEQNGGFNLIPTRTIGACKVPDVADFFPKKPFTALLKSFNTGRDKGLLHRNLGLLAVTFLRHRDDLDASMSPHSVATSFFYGLSAHLLNGTIERTTFNEVTIYTHTDLSKRVHIKNLFRSIRDYMVAMAEGAADDFDFAKYVAPIFDPNFWNSNLEEPLFGLRKMKNGLSLSRSDFGLVRPFRGSSPCVGPLSGIRTVWLPGDMQLTGDEYDDIMKKADPNSVGLIHENNEANQAPHINVMSTTKDIPFTLPQPLFGVERFMTNEVGFDFIYRAMRLAENVVHPSLERQGRVRIDVPNYSVWCAPVDEHRQAILNLINDRDDGSEFMRHLYNWVCITEATGMNFRTLTFSAKSNAKGPHIEALSAMVRFFGTGHMYLVPKIDQLLGLFAPNSPFFDRVIIRAGPKVREPHLLVTDPKARIPKMERLSSDHILLACAADTSDFKNAEEFRSMAEDDEKRHSDKPMFKGLPARSYRNRALFCGRYRIRASQIPQVEHSDDDEDVPDVIPFNLKPLPVDPENLPKPIIDGAVPATPELSSQDVAIAADGI